MARGLAKAILASFVWPGSLATVAPHVSTRIAHALGASAIVAMTAMVAGALAHVSMRSSSNVPEWTDVLSSAIPVMRATAVLLGVPVGVCVWLMLFAVERIGPQYWQSESRMIWRMAVMSPVTAVVPVCMIVNAAMVVVCVRDWSAYGPAWMHSDAAYWVSVAAFPGAYAVIFATGIFRSWKRLRPRHPMKCRCGYLLVGLPTNANCPECGHASLR